MKVWIDYSRLDGKCNEHGCDRRATHYLYQRDLTIIFAAKYCYEHRSERLSGDLILFFEAPADCAIETEFVSYEEYQEWDKRRLARIEGEPLAKAQAKYQGQCERCHRVAVDGKHCKIHQTREIQEP